MSEYLKKEFSARRENIRSRLDEFNLVWKAGNDRRIFEELCFCLLTPQSKAVSANKAMESLIRTGLLYNGTEDLIKPHLDSVRFNEGKSKNIVVARGLFGSNHLGNPSGEIKIRHMIDPSNVKKTRSWLVENVRGMGYKEASHFLRNIGFGQDIAILDRHILKNLAKHKVIEEIPKSLTVKRYLEIEEKTRAWCARLNIGMDEMDLLLWSMETGYIFK